jgi:alpha-tubulin suppressor-like RCC1 family protein
VYCWGSNDQGQLGNGTTTDSAEPVPVQGLLGPVTALAAGFDFTCAIANQRIVCWGNNDHGQLGNGSTADSPVPLPVGPE